MQFGIISVNLIKELISSTNSNTKTIYKRYIIMKLQITIPTSLKDITLEQYQRFVSIAQNNKDGEFLQQKMIEIFCGVPLNLVPNIPLKDFNDIINLLNNMFSEQHKLQTIFKLGNTNFGFIPNLDEISLGEFTDLDSYLGNWENMHRAMAVLYRPITEKFKDKYLIEQYNGSHTYSDVMKHLSMDIVFGANVFFYNLSNELLISTLNYLEQNKEVQHLIDNHNLELNGDGIHLSILSLKAMLEDLMKFQDYHSQPV